MENILALKDKDKQSEGLPWLFHRFTARLHT